MIQQLTREQVHLLTTIQQEYEKFRSLEEVLRQDICHLEYIEQDYKEGIQLLCAWINREHSKRPLPSVHSHESRHHDNNTYSQLSPLPPTFHQLNAPTSPQPSSRPTGA